MKCIASGRSGCLVPWDVIATATTLVGRPGAATSAFRVHPGATTSVVRVNGVGCEVVWARGVGESKLNLNNIFSLVPSEVTQNARQPHPSTTGRMDSQRRSPTCPQKIVEVYSVLVRRMSSFSEKTTKF